MKSVSDKSRRERMNTHVIFKPFSFLNCMFMRRGKTKGIVRFPL